MTRVVDCRDLIAACAGSVFVEYAIALSLVTVGLSLATIALGTLLLQLFRFQAEQLMLPFA